MTIYEDSLTEKRPLHRMFTNVHQRYDLVNHIITWGLDKTWRQAAAKVCLASNPKRVLDLCCGTGDLAIHIAQLVRNKVELFGADYSQPMLAIAARKAKVLANGREISFTYGDADDLPFPDEYFDCIGISFAFRNLTYRNPLAKKYSSEILRTLHIGGRFVIVETSQPKPRVIQWLFHLYLRLFVSRVGHMLSGNRGAYHYLAESAARFYAPGQLQEMLLTAGFSQVSFQPLFMGVTGIHVAIK
jgi:demethylmenaquinone methyltransferase/2-methoxy-6-polyprenyl-1,4-benzoquinol methylase